MNEQQAAILLAKIAVFDNRNTTDAAVSAWADALADTPFDRDTAASVADYYGTPPKDPAARLWMMPYHVKAYRSRVRSQRLRSFVYEPADGDTPEAERRRYRAQREAVASGTVPPPALPTRPPAAPHELDGTPDTDPFADDPEMRHLSGRERMNVIKNRLTLRHTNNQR